MREKEAVEIFRVKIFFSTKTMPITGWNKMKRTLKDSSLKRLSDNSSWETCMLFQFNEFPRFSKPWQENYILRVAFPRGGKIFSIYSENILETLRLLAKYCCKTGKTRSRCFIWRDKLPFRMTLMDSLILLWSRNMVSVALKCKMKFSNL